MFREKHYSENKKWVTACSLKIKREHVIIGFLKVTLIVMIKLG
jgi:hypothetical protein